MYQSAAMPATLGVATNMPAPSSPVQDQLNALNIALESLRSQLGLLSVRLQPVVSPMPPAAAADGGKNLAAVVSCSPVLEQVAMFSRFVEGMDRELGGLIARLEV